MDKNYVFTESYDDDGDYSCPHCFTALSISNIPNMDFIDGEEHEVTCSQCDKKFVIVIQRPIVVETWMEAKEKAQEEFEEAATSPFCDPKYIIVPRKDNI